MVPSCVSVETDVMPHRNMTHASTTALMAQKSTASILRMASLPFPLPTGRRSAARLWDKHRERGEMMDDVRLARR